MGKQGSADKTIREIRRRTRRQFSAEEEIRIVIEGLSGEESVAALCPCPGKLWLSPRHEASVGRERSSWRKRRARLRYAQSM